jgi:hypothetical protein
MELSSDDRGADRERITRCSETSPAHENGAMTVKPASRNAATLATSRVVGDDKAGLSSPVPSGYVVSPPSISVIGVSQEESVSASAWGPPYRPDQCTRVVRIATGAGQLRAGSEILGSLLVRIGFYTLSVHRRTKAPKLKRLPAIEAGISDGCPPLWRL